MNEWKRETPTTPGRYQFRYIGHHWTCVLNITEDGFAVDRGFQFPCHPRYWNPCEWSGPIIEPYGASEDAG